MPVKPPVSRREPTESASRSCALVTGASSGIGRAFATRLARDGYEVVLVARRAAALSDLRATLPGSGHTIVAADLTTTPGLARVAAVFDSRRINMFVNNAGAGYYGAFAKASWESQESLIKLNTVAPARLAHRFLRQAEAGDTLVNVSSIMAYLPQPTSAIYSATKAFLSSFSAALAYESQDRGIHLLCVHPGMTQTEFRLRAGGTSIYPRGVHQPDDVVKLTLDALAGRRRNNLICGLLNRLLCLLAQLLPTQAVVNYLGKTRSYEPQRSSP